MWAPPGPLVPAERERPGGGRPLAVELADTPDEGAVLGRMIEGHTHVIEVRDLAARVAELEWQLLREADGEGD